MFGLCVCLMICEFVSYVLMFALVSVFISCCFALVGLVVVGYCFEVFVLVRLVIILF